MKQNGKYENNTGRCRRFKACLAVDADDDKAIWVTG